MNYPPMPYMAAFVMADNAARILADERPSQHQVTDDIERICPGSRASSRRSHMILRDPAVTALRWLWENGDAVQRTTVACRVGVWLNLGKDRVQALSTRIREREVQRTLKEAACR